jgi:hypothetical protein
MLSHKSPGRILRALIIAALVTCILGASRHDGSEPGHSCSDSCFFMLEFGACDGIDVGSHAHFSGAASLRGFWSGRQPATTATVGLPGVRAPPVRSF